MYISIKHLAAADLHDCGWNAVCCCVTVFYVSSLNMCRESPGTLFFFFSHFSIVKHLHKSNLVTYGSFTESTSCHWNPDNSMERKLPRSDHLQTSKSFKTYAWLWITVREQPSPPPPSYLGPKKIKRRKPDSCLLLSLPLFFFFL